MKKGTLSFCVLVMIIVFAPGSILAEVFRVGVVNDEQYPIPTYDVQKKMKTPFQWGASNVQFNPEHSGGSASFTVPDGKRLVIEYVTGNLFLDSGEFVLFSVSTTVNGVLVGHQMLLTPMGPAGGFGKSYTSSHRTVLYADPGTDVVLYGANTLAGPAAMHVSVSGYLVDVP